jgi:EAL domain-containing protein (putative c-di-GMP-specific phosphodiesterase class I)
VTRRELTVHFQPQYEIDFGRGCGVEALARWTTSDGEQISPTVFIPIAERIGAICPLGAWVLEHACETVAAPVPAADARALLSMPWGTRLAPRSRASRANVRGLHAA